MASFRLTQEQDLLKDSVQRFFGDLYSFEERRKIVQSPAAFSADIWAKAAALGWLPIPFDEDEGGLGGGVVDLNILFEQIGRSLAVEPFLETLVAAGGVIRRSTHERRAEWIDALIAGRLHGAFACIEEHGRCEPDDLQTLATENDPADGFVLSGRKINVGNAEQADLIIVWSLLRRKGEPDMPALFAVTPDAAKMKLDAYTTIDGRRAATVEFDQTPLARSCLIAEGSAATRIFQEVYSDILLALSAEQIGAIDALIEKTADFARERRQFGSQLSKFQAIQHMLADMTIQAELARSLTHAAARAAQDGDPDAPALVAAARAKSDAAGRFVAETAIQIHGAIGTTQELSIGHYLKRNLASGCQFGGYRDFVGRFISQYPLEKSGGAL